MTNLIEQTIYPPGRPRRRRHEPGYEVRDTGFETPCYIWTGQVDAEGYGRLGNRTYAHVFHFGRVHGPVPDGMILHHRCEQRRCVNANHLTTVSRAQHMTIHREYPADLVEEIRRASGSTRQIARRYGISKSHAWYLRRPISR